MPTTALLLPIGVLFPLLALCQESRPDPGFDQEHALFTTLLRAHVRGDRFGYASLKKDRADLDRYLATLEHVSPEDLRGWSKPQQLAFWINAYNAYTLALVAEHYPVRSIRDIGDDEESVWDRRFVPLGRLGPEGSKALLTLNEIEHEILRSRFADPRVHAAINCASESCPALRREAYRAKDLERALGEQVRAWLADRTRNRFDREARTAHLSRIFEWFAADFGDAGVLAWVARYAPETERSWLREPGVRVEYLDYSWKLNDAR